MANKAKHGQGTAIPNEKFAKAVAEGKVLDEKAAKAAKLAANAGLDVDMLLAAGMTQTEVDEKVEGRRKAATNAALEGLSATETWKAFRETVKALPVAVEILITKPAEGEVTIRIKNSRSSGKVGAPIGTRALLVDGTEYESGKAACLALGYEVNGDSAPRLLRKKGHTVEMKREAAVKPPPKASATK